MILEIGKKLKSGEIEYKVVSLVHSDKGGYREVYSAISFAQDKLIETVRLIVYREPEISKRTSAHSIFLNEARLRKKLTGSSFDNYRTQFGTLQDDRHPLLVIVTGMKEAKTLSDVIATDDIGKTELWRIFMDVVIGLNEISHVTNGGCHFGISPDNVYVYRNSNMELHGLIRGLNLVCDDFEENDNLDKRLILPAYRAPETNIQKFGPKSMQWSLALLLTFMLQKTHPWGLTSDTNVYQAYTRFRRIKPQIIYAEGLGNVLQKALCINPAQRYEEIDDFIAEVMKYSKLPMPASYECFGKPLEENPAFPSSLSFNKVDETGEEEDDDNSEESTFSALKEPKATVKISAQKGEGLEAVAGMTQLKEELYRDFINIVANRKLAAQYDIYPPGMLFYGPPGCGKTYLAEHLGQHLANASGLEYSIVNPSDLGSIFIHGSQKMIADLFSKAEQKAKKNGKGVLLIFDEVESLLPSRMSERNENQAGEVAEFLTRLNNSSKRGVYVIGLTNCLDKIDRAVLRKGRLDKVVYVDLPDLEARKALFEYELSKRPCDTDIDVGRLAIITEGYTSSDISYIVAESARLMFAYTIREGSQVPLRINSTVLEEVVAKTRSSVTQSDRLLYENMREQYTSGRKKQRPSVGFSIDA